MVARVHENDLEVREPEVARGSFPEIAVRVEARATSFECHFSSVGRSVVGEAFMVARVHENDLEVMEPEAARGSFPETTEARGGAWHGFR